MHYYSFKIGDYHSHTSHLSEMEDLSYRRMMDWMYLHESPLPADADQIARLIRMRTHTDCIAAVLREFFELTDFGYVQKHVMEEIELFRAKSKKAKASANARWAKQQVNSYANALETHSECNANQEPITNNQEPTNKPTAPTGAPDCPHLEVIAAYHEILPELQGVVVDRWPGSSRARDLQARWRESPKHQSVDFWRRYFTQIRTFPHQMGENDRGWRADLGWLVKRGNFDKMIERILARQS